MDQNNLKQLLILEMKRVIEILESKDELKTNKTGEDGYPTLDKDISELKAKLHEIRRDSIRLEKSIGY